MFEEKIYTTVAILIACHNRANDIEKLIKHLYKIECPQNVKLSIHVIDDLSSDNSVEIIKKLQEKYSSLSLIQNKENKGLFFNRIILAGSVDSDYIFFMDDDDEVDNNLLTEFAKYTNYDLVRTIRKSFIGSTTTINFEDRYKDLKVPVDMINLMTIYYITGTFISKYVYKKMFATLAQVNCDFLKLNIYEDQPYFYLMTNFARNFVFMNCYYHYIINRSGLIHATSYERTFKDGMRIWEILIQIVKILKKNDCYNISPEFMQMNLWHLIWSHDNKNKECKLLHDKFCSVNWDLIKRSTFKNKLKCILLKNYLTFLVISYLVKPFLKI